MSFENTTDKNCSEIEPGGCFNDCNTYLQILYTYYIPFIVVVGFLGNVQSALVFLTTHLKLRSSSYYLAALAVADFGFLFVVLIVHCSFNNLIEIYNTNGWCQFFVYISSVCATLSVWLTVAFTVERFIAVQYPLQRPYICTVSRAKIIVFTITFIALTTQSYVFWIAGLISDDDKMICEMLPDYENFAKIVTFLDTIANLIVPFLLIVTMNTMIARNLLHFKRRLQLRSLDQYLSRKNEFEVTNSQSSSFTKQQSDRNSRDSHYKFNFTKKSSMKNSDKNLEKFPSTTTKKPTARNCISLQNQENINKMLLIISSVFIALNFPSYLIRLYVCFMYTLRNNTTPDTSVLCLQQFAMLLYYTNFSINFMLYAMCGETFRHCLIQLLRGIVRKFSTRHSICCT